MESPTFIFNQAYLRFITENRQMDPAAAHTAAYVFGNNAVAEWAYEQGKCDTLEAQIEDRGYGDPQYPKNPFEGRVNTRLRFPGPNGWSPLKWKCHSGLWYPVSVTGTRISEEGISEEKFIAMMVENGWAVEEKEPF